MQAHPDELSKTPPPEPIPDSPETRCFSPISLADWLKLCQRANVPYVPARHVATLNRVDCLRFEEPSYDARNSAAIEQAQNAAHYGEMLRFDCCAGLDTKLLSDEGARQWHPDTPNIYMGDPRAYDIFFAHHREAIPIWARPWITAMIHGSHPVEYRAYVEDGKLIGVSNYHNQRPLPLNPGHLQIVARYTRALIENAETPFLWNMDPDLGNFCQEHSPDDVHFTAEFIVARTGRVLFLESGPPHELGGHHCCFEPFNPRGTALAKNRVLPYLPY